MKLIKAEKSKLSNLKDTFLNYFLGQRENVYINENNCSKKLKGVAKAVLRTDLLPAAYI